MTLLRVALLVLVFVASALAQGPPPPSITLAWTLSTSPGVTAQYICRGLGPGLEKYSPNCLVQNIGPTITTYTDNDPLLVRGQQYCYTAEAFTTILSQPSNEACATIPFAPAPQTGLGAVAH